METVELDNSLDPNATRVRAAQRVKTNPRAGAPAALVLDGDDLQLEGLTIDGEPVAPERYSLTSDRLTIPQPPHHPFVLTVETVINPSANTQLMGLYRSGGSYMSDLT